MMLGFLNRKKTDEINIEQVYNKIEELNNKIIVLDKGFHDLKQDLSVLNDGFGRQLTVFFDEFNSNLNDFLEDLPLNECDCACLDSEVLVDSHDLLSEPVNDVDGVDYVHLIHERLKYTNSYGKLYSPKGLFFDGYNFISIRGKKSGDVLFNIDILNSIRDDLYNICEKICRENNFSCIYHDFKMTEKTFKRLLFNIIEGNFDNLEPFMEYPLKQSINIDKVVDKNESKPKINKRTRDVNSVWSLENSKGDDFKIKSYNITNNNLINFKTNNGQDYNLCDVLTLLYLNEYINKNTVYIADFNRLGKEWNINIQKIERICVNLLKGNLNMILEDIHEKYTKNVSFKFRDGFLFIKGHQTNILYRTVSEFIYELNNTSRPVQLLISYLYVHDFELDDLLYIMFNYNNQSLVGLLKTMKT